MTGMQKTAYEAVKEVAANILSGKYGKDDDIDIDALEDDILDMKLWLLMQQTSGEMTAIVDPEHKEEDKV